MTGMMRGGRFNSQCPCCNDDVCDGFRTREKNEWKKEVEEYKGLGPSFAAFDELSTIEPQIFKVSAEEYDKLEKLLAEPPQVNERLKRLLKGKE
jgi:uncharacterized metal-binding protein